MPDISHLMDAEAVPDTTPSAGVLASGAQIETAGGMRAFQSGDDVLLDGGDDGTVATSETVSDVDPLRYMSFRAKRVGNTIEVQTSYLEYAYYSDGWIHATHTIAPETLALPAGERYLYLKLPVIFVSGLDDPDAAPIIQWPHGIMESAPRTINGSTYLFRISYSTGYVTRDTTAALPGNYFVLTETLQNSLTDTAVPGSLNFTGFYYFLLARATPTGVQQIHVGAHVMPQPHTFNLLDFTVI